MNKERPTYVTPSSDESREAAAGVLIGAIDARPVVLAWIAGTLISICQNTWTMKMWIHTRSVHLADNLIMTEELV